MAISKKSWAGIAVEATPGTAMTSPTKFLPCKSILKGTRKQEYLNEERGTRDGNYGAVSTTRDGDWNPSGPWYNDVTPYLLICALGADTVSQPDASHVPTVYKHSVALADVPPSLTVFKSYDAAVYYAAYSVLEKFGLKFAADGKLLEFSSGFKTLFPVKYTGSMITPSFSTLLPFAGYAPTLTLNGASTSDIDEVSIDFEQKVTEWYPIAGSPDWAKAYFGERTVKLDFTARFDVSTFYDTYWISQQQGSFQFDVQGALIANSGGSGTPPNTNYYEELNMTIANINFDSFEHDLGKDNVLVKVKGTGIVNGGTLISAWVQNTVDSYAS